MKQINSTRKNEKITGAFFIAATSTAILAVLLYNPVLQPSDVLTAASHASTRVSLGALSDLLLAISNIGTGIMLYPKLKKHSESWGLGYALFRLLEVVFILIGVVSMLSIVSLGSASENLSGNELISMQAGAGILKTIYAWCFILGPHFMLGVNTFIYSSIFFLSGLVPRRLSTFGILGAVLIFMGAVLEIVGIIPHFSSEIMVLALPIALYEMVLAGWLIARGFKQEETSPIDSFSSQMPHYQH